MARFYRVRPRGARAFFIRVTSESEAFVVGIEVDRKTADEIVPVERNRDGEHYTDRTHIVEKANVVLEAYREDFKYGGLTACVSEPDTI